MEYCKEILSEGVAGQHEMVKFGNVPGVDLVLREMLKKGMECYQGAFMQYERQNRGNKMHQRTVWM